MRPCIAVLIACLAVLSARDANATTINFDDRLGPFLADTAYESLGVTFCGTSSAAPSVCAQSVSVENIHLFTGFADPSSPPNAIEAGKTGFIKATFVSPVSSVQIDARSFVIEATSLAVVSLNAYTAANTEVGHMSSFVGGYSTLSVISPTDDISYVLLSARCTDSFLGVPCQSIGVFDNLSFTSSTAAAPVPEPATGLLIGSASACAGIAALYRRREDRARRENRRR